MTQRQGTQLYSCWLCESRCTCSEWYGFIPVNMIADTRLCLCSWEHTVTERVCSSCRFQQTVQYLLRVITALTTCHVHMISILAAALELVSVGKLQGMPGAHPTPAALFVSPNFRRSAQGADGQQSLAVLQMSDLAPQREASSMQEGYGDVPRAELLHPSQVLSGGASAPNLPEFASLQDASSEEHIVQWHRPCKGYQAASCIRRL